jgi:Flp pilus assembly protein TadG
MTYFSERMTATAAEADGLRLRNGTSRLALLSRFRRDESGSFTIFALFFFLMMVLIGGMAVDLMRFETRRVHLQNTLDAATLAATNLRQQIDSEVLVRDFMAKQGYDPALVRVDNQESRVGGDPTDPRTGTLVSRRLTADYDLSVNTFFMHMIDYPTLSTTTGSGAFERVQNVEISLVVDISGSMAGSRLTALKDSAKNFVDAVIDDTATEYVTSLSIIPYNHNVVVPDSLLDRLNTTGTIEIPVSQRARPSSSLPPYPGALTEYPRTSTMSKCVRFSNDQLITNNLQEHLAYEDNPNWAQLRAITPTTELDRMAYYDPDTKSAGPGGAFDRPADSSNRRCDPSRSPLLPFGTNTTALKNYIDTLTADGWTAIDNGTKWGVALLDPAMRPVINSMVDDNILPETVRGRPGNYDPVNTMKVVVLMTDGANTTQYDLANQFKNGPSRIWFSEQASREWGPNGEDWRNLHIVDLNADGVKDRNKVWEDGYYVEMPSNSANRRFLRQHRLGTSGSNASDGVRYSTTAIPSDLRQLHYVELYERFSERAVAEFFRDNNFGDTTALNAHWDAERTVQNANSADRRLSGAPRTSTSDFGICDAAKVVQPGAAQPDMLVFTIAFAAGTHASNVLRDCATAPSYAFDAANEQQLRQAFASIAGAITKLRLTQ